MRRKLILPGVAALGLLGGAAPAQTPADPPAGGPPRQVIRWPGGWLFMDGPEVITRQASRGGSTTVITDSATGAGSRIVVDNGGNPGVTVIRNSRTGAGSSVTVTPAGPVIDLTPRPPAPAPPAVEYKGRAAKFWAKKVYDEDLGRNVYWSAKDRLWFRYDKRGDAYRSLPAGYDPDPE